jgi:hypothetical protein
MINSPRGPVRSARRAWSHALRRSPWPVSPCCLADLSMQRKLAELLSSREDREKAIAVCFVQTVGVRIHACIPDPSSIELLARQSLSVQQLL